MGFELNFISSSTLGAATAKTAVWFDGTYLYVGDDNNYLFAASWDGSNFTLIDSEKVIDDATTNDAMAIYGDGTYIYVCRQASTGWVAAFTFDGTTLTRVGTVSLGVINPNTIYCDTLGYIYVGCNNDYIYAYTFDGAIFTLKGSVDADYVIYKIIGDGTYLHCSRASNGASLIAYSFNGTTFTPLATRGANDVTYGALFSYGVNKIALVYSTEFFDILSFNGSSYTQITSTAISTTGVYRGMSYDGTYFYVVSSGVALYAFTTPSDVPTLTNQIIDAGISPSTYYHTIDYGDGTVYYVSGNYIKAAKMEVEAQFTATPLTGNVPLTVTFTAE